jgi:hypothetical protein
MLPIPTRTIASVTLGAGTGTVVMSATGTAGLPFVPRHIVVRTNAQTSGGYDLSILQVQFNSDVGSNYNSQNIQGDGAAVAAGRVSNATNMRVGYTPDGSLLAGTALGGNEFLLPDAYGTRSHQSMISLSGVNEDRVSTFAGRWASTAAVVSVTFTSDSGTFIAKSIFELAVVDEMFAIPGAETILT